MTTPQIHEALAVDVVRHSGALVVSALVDDHGQHFYESRTYYGYDEDEAKDSFVDHVSEMGYEFVTD